MQITVLGPGCANCRATHALVEEVAREKGVAVGIDKVEDIREIARFGIAATPGVAIDGVVVHAGGVPSRAKVEQWFAAFGAKCCNKAARGTA